MPSVPSDGPWGPRHSHQYGHTGSDVQGEKSRAPLVTATWRFSPQKSCRLLKLGLLGGHEMGHRYPMVSAVRLGVGLRLSVDVSEDAAATIAGECREIGDGWALEIAEALSTALGEPGVGTAPRQARPASGCYRLVARAR